MPLSIENINAQISVIIEEYGTSNQLLDKLADLLKQFTYEKDFWISRFRPANHNEELLYEIIVNKSSGISLCLVSDGVDVKSPPHTHHTWAIIAGISGVELNRMYVVTDHQKRTVKEVKVVTVGPGDVAVFTKDDIHSTEVTGHQPTYHLHMYGCDLKSLPAFNKRTFFPE